MRLFDRYLVALLTMLGLAGGLVYAPLRASTPEITTSPSSVSYSPITVEGWVGTQDAPGEILPVDPRAKENARWSYRRGDRVIWVAIAVYGTRDNLESRPSVNLIVSERGASDLSQSTTQVGMSSDQGAGFRAKQLIMARPSGHLAVVYWYVLGSKIISDEYRLRLDLLMNSLLRKGENLILVRVATAHPTFATPSSSVATLEEFLQAFFPKITGTRT
jgi:EpsI family protein